MHQGQPLLKERQIVVYDGGGGGGSSRCRYYDPCQQKIRVTSPLALHCLDGKQFDPKCIIVRDWKALIPNQQLMLMRNFSCHPFMHNPQMMCRLPSLVKLPRLNWDNHYKVLQTGLRVCPEMEPVKCWISTNDLVWADGNMITIRPYSGIASTRDEAIPKEKDVIEYDPDEEPNAIVKRNQEVLTFLTEEYKQFILGIRPQRDIKI